MIAAAEKTVFPQNRLHRKIHDQDTDRGLHGRTRTMLVPKHFLQTRPLVSSSQGCTTQSIARLRECSVRKPSKCLTAVPSELGLSASSKSAFA
jgi:hypothetical protein